MKISDTTISSVQALQVKQTLINLLNQPSDKDERPCPGCRYAVGNGHSTTTSAYCSADCIHASQQMSSDPEKYPIEQGIVPLVYAFYTTRLLTPCWSCEGHANAEGEVYKTPKVWFYAASDLYSKIVASYVSKLKGEKKLNHHWIVKILPFSQSPFATTYSLEPQDVEVTKPQLTTLQQDVKVIARHLRHDVLQQASYYLTKIEQIPIHQI